MEPEKISEGRVVAFIDIGTNSIRLLLVRINPNGSFQPLTKQKETVRLGDKEFIDRDSAAEGDGARSYCL